MYLNVDLYFSHPNIIDVCCLLCCGYRRKIHILYMYEPVSKNRLLGSYGQRGYCPQSPLADLELPFLTKNDFNHFWVVPGCTDL